MNFYSRLIKVNLVYLIESPIADREYQNLIQQHTTQLHRSAFEENTNNDDRNESFTEFSCSESEEDFNFLYSEIEDESLLNECLKVDEPQYLSEEKKPIYDDALITVFEFVCFPMS